MWHGREETVLPKRGVVEQATPIDASFYGRCLQVPGHSGVTGDNEKSRAMPQILNSSISNEAHTQIPEIKQPQEGRLQLQWELGIEKRACPGAS